LSLSNFNSIYGSGTYSNIGTIDVIFDFPSYNMWKNLTTLNSLSTSGTSGYGTSGYRVWSAPADYYEVVMDPSGIVPYVYIQDTWNIPNNTANGFDSSTQAEGYISVPYNNIWNISSSNTNTSQELLLANGYFTTNKNYYLDYDASYNGNTLNTGYNYTNLASSYTNNGLTGFKTATFAWDISNNLTQYTNINFVIVFKQTLYKNSSTGFYYFSESTQDSTTQLGLYYRFENRDDVTLWGSDSVNGYYPTTTWISINSNTTGQSSSISANIICSSENSTNVYWSSLNTTYPLISGNQYIFQSSLPTIYLNNNATLYLRIGIPNGYDGFNSIYAYVS
jgi:hypothetical protein